MAAVGLPEVTPPTGVAHDEKLRLRFIATRVEPNLAAPFFARGGALGSACARAETDFSLSGAEFCTSAMVNEAAAKCERSSGVRRTPHYASLDVVADRDASTNARASGL